MKQLSRLLPSTINARLYTESPIEVILFHEMMRTPPFVLCQENDEPSGEGYFIFPQKHIGPYRADFIIRGISYVPYARVWPPEFQATICVECDGKEFHTTKEQKEYDERRDKYFSENSIKTLRFTGEDITKNSKFCVDEIIHTIESEMRR